MLIWNETINQSIFVGGDFTLHIIDSKVLFLQKYQTMYFFKIKIKTLDKSILLNIPHTF